MDALQPPIKLQGWRKKVNEAIEAYGGTCLRAVILWRHGPPMAKLPKLKSNVRVENGYMKQLSHWSESCQAEMTLPLCVPPRPPDQERAPPPVLYFLWPDLQ